MNIEGFLSCFQHCQGAWLNSLTKVEGLKALLNNFECLVLALGLFLTIT